MRSVLQTRIRIHYSWVLVLALIPWAVSTQYSTETAFTVRILLGLATALYFFIAVLFRELVLLIVAAYKGIGVRSVTIFAFGGLVRTDRETDSPALAMLLAVSGMLCNFVIAGLFYFSFLVFGNPENLFLDVPLKWLAFFYFTLSLFHIFPVYPLEGGRMLQVLVWRITGDFRRATRIAGISGWALGFLVMAGGIVLIVFTEERFTGMFFTGLGLIIQNAATHGMRSIKNRPVPDSSVPPTPVLPPARESAPDAFPPAAGEVNSGQTL